MARALELQGGDQFDGFLKSRDIFEPRALEDIEQDIASIERLGY